MQPQPFDLATPRHLPPLRAVIDTCVFPRLRILTELLLAAQAGYVQLVWSPWIIAETHRVLTCRWIERHLKAGRAWDNAAKRLLSQHSHTWMTRVAPAFEVIDDRPPLAPMWIMPPPDEYDWPVWTAAVRGRAQFLITSNLKDGAPPDARGIRQWQGITYLGPEHFLVLLDAWGDLSEAGAHRPVLTIAEYWDQRFGHGETAITLDPSVEALIAEIERRFRGQ